jgi:uncharacterized membrane protein
LNKQLTFFLNRIRQKLWVKPSLVCILSIGVALGARAADSFSLASLLPDVKLDSVEALLTNLSASMLVIATFAVASMVSSYASASQNATPRSFPLIVADDVSQNALATFIGAFIFSVVGIVAVKNGYYGNAGRFVLLTVTLAVFLLVILTFVRWVDRIARLGRLSMIVEKIEKTTATAIRDCLDSPRQGGKRPNTALPVTRSIQAPSVGYVQRIDMDALQEIAESADLQITVCALPGSFAVPSKSLADIADVQGNLSEEAAEKIAAAFTLGRNRTFDEDPRFGFISLAEISGRALSPGINDPGTAITIVGVFVRLFVLWSTPRDLTASVPVYDRVAVPRISLNDLFEDAFTTTARDGAGCVEVAVRLQKAFAALAQTSNPEMKDVAKQHARLALKRVEQAMNIPEDIERVRQSAEPTVSTDAGQVELK